MRALFSWMVKLQSEARSKEQQIYTRFPRWECEEPLERESLNGRWKLNVEGHGFSRAVSDQ
jgi:hypothetical protein